MNLNINRLNKIKIIFNINMENKENKKVMKCLKSYLTGKKYYETDLDKSFEYFKQFIVILNDIKDKKVQINPELTELMDETETECSKYLTMAIESTIEQPYVREKNNNNVLFDIIETGSIDKLKEYKYGEVNFTEFNNMGYTPLHCAISFGDTTFLKHAFRLGACIDTTNKFGHTLLEFACLAKDPNLINFIVMYGGDMKKHLKFREDKKYFSSGNQIDIMLLEKIILDQYKETKKYSIQYLNKIICYIDMDEVLDIQYYDNKINKKLIMKDLILRLDYLLHSIDEDKRNTYIQIIEEELSHKLHNKLGCPNNLLEIILYNLVPFIEYNDSLKLDWLISLEIKFLILKVLKNKTKINTKQLKLELKELLNKNYIDSNLVSEGMIHTLVLQWINKIKV